MARERSERDDSDNAPGARGPSASSSSGRHRPPKGGSRGHAHGGRERVAPSSGKAPPPAPGTLDTEDDATAGGLILPGGKLSEDAVRAAFEQARAQRAAERGGDEADEVDEGDEASGAGAEAAGGGESLGAPQFVPRIRFTLRHDLQKRLDKYLVDRVGFMSRTALQKLIDDGGVTVNTRSPKASTVLRAGDVVEMLVPEPPPKNIQPEDIPLDVLYEDEHIIVLNKQPDIIVHPARSHLKGTMLSALAFHFRNRSRTGGNLSTVGEQFARPGVVHRLDRHTSGCIVFAKTDEAHWKLGKQFEQRRVEKRYLALTHGRIEPPGDAIDLPLGPHPSREKGYREKYVVRHDELGKASLTIYRVREWYSVAPVGATRAGERRAPASAPPRPAPGWSDGDAGSASTSPPAPTEHPTAVGDWRSALSGSRGPVTESPFYTLVELELKTGRTHQIRVHLSHTGWPIVGDDMYTGRPYADGAGTVLLARQALHAALLGFDHPITGERLTFTAPLRGDIAAVVHDLRTRGLVERPELPGTMVDLDAALRHT
jgi:RluA family pseudouridine synthase